MMSSDVLSISDYQPTRKEGMTESLCQAALLEGNVCGRLQVHNNVQNP